MARGSASSVLTALGLPAELDRTYQRVLRQSGRDLTAVAGAVGLAPEELLARLGPLIEEGIVRVAHARVYVETPAETLPRLIAEQATAASHSQERLAALAAAVPFLAAGSAPDLPGLRDVEPIDGETTSGGDIVTLIADLLAASTGDLMWLRPDQWRFAWEPTMRELVREAVASGRRCRAIYPVRALQEAPERLRARAADGEQIRLLPDLPTRMLVVGTSCALLPEPLGFADDPRTLLRQAGIVEALALLFDTLWERAAPVPELDRGATRTDLRRFLLEQLATGAQDEQVARTLGVSLRTVRRRVADLMAELGADSRFQAGVEAARRGWL